MDKFDLSSIKSIMSGAAPLSGELAEAVHQRLHCHVKQGYGMSELSPVCHVTPEEYNPKKAGAIGWCVLSLSGWWASLPVSL